MHLRDTFTLHVEVSITWTPYDLNKRSYTQTMLTYESSI